MNDSRVSDAKRSWFSEKRLWLIGSVFGIGVIAVVFALSSFPADQGEMETSPTTSLTKQITEITAGSWAMANVPTTQLAGDIAAATDRYARAVGAVNDYESTLEDCLKAARRSLDIDFDLFDFKESKAGSSELEGVSLFSSVLDSSPPDCAITIKVEGSWNLPTPDSNVEKAWQLASFLAVLWRSSDGILRDDGSAVQPSLELLVDNQKYLSDHSLMVQVVENQIDKNDWLSVARQ